VGGSLSALSVAYTGGNAGATYQWYSNTSAANTGGTILNGETNATYNLPSGLNNTAAASYYYCVINFGTGSGCSVITSNVATISVLADPTFSVQPIPTQTICEGGSVGALSATVTGGSGTNSYQWYTVSGTNYTAITTNGTSATYTPPTFTVAGTFNYAVLVTQSVSGCASTYSANATVSVVLDPSVTAPTGASYCQNASPVTPLTVTASVGNGSAYTYQWFSNSTNTNSGGTSQANSNSASFTPPVTTTGTLYYYCLVTNSPSNSGCATASNTAEITVNTAPTFATPPFTSQTVCLDGTFNALTVATQNGTGTPTFQWYSNNTSSTSGGTPISGATSASYTPPPFNSIGYFYYYVEISLSGNGCGLIKSNPSEIIVVGDRHQGIFAWRGAINGFDTIPEDFETFYLTESFRFTSEIATMASKLLYIAGEDKEVIGRAVKPSVTNPISKAIICRTNSMILSYLLNAVEREQKVYCLADLKDLWSKMYHISSLWAKDKPKFPNAELVRFKDYAQLKAEAEHDSNLARLVNLTVALSKSPGLHTNITNIKNVLVELPEEADFTLTTAHKSKGLEWDSVELADDLFFLNEDITVPEALANNQTLNLLYVAVTRAKYHINIPLAISLLLLDYEDYKEEYLEIVNK
jgi:hypothetical protein